LLGDGVKASAAFEAYKLLAQAFLARETTAETRSARDAAMRAFELATTNFERAATLPSRGKAQIRLGEEKAARATLDRALDENPHGKVAYTRLAALLLRRDEPDETLRLANRLSSRGVGHSRLLALAKLGRVEAARAFDNLAPTDARALCGLRKRPSRVQQGARRAFRPIMKKPIIDLAFVLSLLRSPHLCRSCRP
jgi:tetratricopeptide (TPR) repeat protein